MRMGISEDWGFLEYSSQLKVKPPFTNWYTVLVYYCARCTFFPGLDMPVGVLVWCVVVVCCGG